MQQKLFKNKLHLEYLDSLRGIASLTVVCSHYVLAYGLPTNSSNLIYWLTFSPLHIWWDGFAAVSLFFVLSGFVLSLKYYSDPQTVIHINAREFINYVIARVCRIWLPYFFCFGISVVLLFLTVPLETTPASSPWARGFWQGLPAPSAILAEMALILPGAGYRIVPQAWTLKLELLLSLFVPFAILLASRSVWLLLAGSAIAVLLIKMPLYWMHFLAGIMLAKYYLAWQERAVSKKILAALLGAGLFFYTFRFTLPIYAPGVIAEHRIFYMTGLGSALLLLFLMKMPAWQRFLEQRSLLLLGKCSYGIYLLHFAVILCLTPRALALANWAGITDFRFAWWWGLVVTLAVTILGGLIFFRVVEAPSILLGKFLVRRRGLNKILAANKPKNLSSSPR